MGTEFASFDQFRKSIEAWAIANKFTPRVLKKDKCINLGTVQQDANLEIGPGISCTAPIHSAPSTSVLRGLPKRGVVWCEQSTARIAVWGPQLQLAVLSVALKSGCSLRYPERLWSTRIQNLRQLLRQSS